MNRYTDIHLQAIDDCLAVVRGVDGERLGDWILDEQRAGPWTWIPVAAEAPRGLAPADNLVAAMPCRSAAKKRRRHRPSR